LGDEPCISFLRIVKGGHQLHCRTSLFLKRKNRESLAQFFGEVKLSVRAGQIYGFSVMVSATDAELSRQRCAGVAVVREMRFRNCIICNSDAKYVLDFPGAAT
jgi:hypothetical protein